MKKKKIDKKQVVWIFKAMIIMVTILAIVKIMLNYTVNSDSLKLLLNWAVLVIVFTIYAIYFIRKKLKGGK